MSANKYEALLNGETHLIQVKKEVVDYHEAQHEEEEEEKEEEEEEEEEDDDDDDDDDDDADADADEDVMASVSEEIPIERKKKRLRNSDVELENVENESQKLRRRISEEFNSSSSCVMVRAEKIEANLDPQYPCFIKLLSRKSSEMYIPKEFSKKHLPDHDKWIVLLGENGEEYTVRFLVRLVINRPMFSAGWKVFLRKHDLREGDGLVFQLVSPCKFKVYIVRQNVRNDRIIMNASPKEINRVKPKKVDAKGLNKSGTHNKAESILHPKIVHDNSLIESHSNYSKNCLSNSQTKSMDGSFVDFRSFTITVNGFNINSELSENIRKKYYELCLSRKLYLHEHLRKTIKPRFAAEIISGTVEIVDAIRGSGIFTSDDDFVDWDKTLHGIELLGMNVGFLRSRLNQLKQKQAVLKSEVQRCEVMFQEAAQAEW